MVKAIGGWLLIPIGPRSADWQVPRPESEFWQWNDAMSYHKIKSEP
jgi:hypothetical protein